MRQTLGTWVRWGIVVSLAGASSLSAQEGKLDRLQHEVHDEHAHKSDEGDDESSSEDGDEGWDIFDGIIGDVCDAVAEYTLFIPFWVPRVALGDDDLVPGDFDAYPYRRGPGFWKLPADVPAENLWSVRPRFELGSDFDDLTRVGLGLEFEHRNRFIIDATWNRWHEDLASGATNEVDIGDVNVVYRFAQSAHAAYRFGVGMNYFDDSIDDEYGFNLTYGAEFLPAKPLTAGFEIDYGALGEASLTHYRGQVGFVLERFELFGSLDYYDVDGVVLRSYGVGLRGWF